LILAENILLKFFYDCSALVREEASDAG
jgi:hypothetical protein